MANAYVFPGGITEKSDFDERWSKIFKIPNNQSLPNKICALREVFEETGILFSKQKFKISNDWRKKVLSDPNQFIELFIQNDLTPDIDLKDWARWITPNVEKFRYDTYFYSKKLDVQNLNEVSVDDKEVTTHAWFSPNEAIDEFEKGNIFLARIFSFLKKNILVILLKLQLGLL